MRLFRRKATTEDESERCRVCSERAPEERTSASCAERTCEPCLCDRLEARSNTDGPRGEA